MSARRVPPAARGRLWCAWLGITEHPGALHSHMLSARTSASSTMVRVNPVCLTTAPLGSSAATTTRTGLDLRNGRSSWPNLYGGETNPVLDLAAAEQVSSARAPDDPRVLPQHNRAVNVGGTYEPGAAAQPAQHVVSPRNFAVPVPAVVG